MFQPVAQAVKKHLYDLLKEKYHPHEAAIDRLAASAPAQRDAEDLLKLFNAVFQTGFERAVDSYKEQLRKMGYRVSIVYEEKDGV